MSTLKRIFTNWWVLSLLAVTVFLIVFVLLLPMLVLSFEPWSVRIVIAGLIVAVWIALAVWRIVSARRASGRIARSLDAIAPEGEGAVLAERMRAALAALRRMKGRGGDYLYSRPWYVIIGPPGAGKTTALENSGLHFLTEGGAPSSVGGTRNIQFIFADEAVLIDTAGRYTSQDSDTARDRDAWKQFLDLLRRNRPLQPINGVIVALGLDDLARADLAALDHHARIVRDRLRELQTSLALHIPVYVLFTKADLIAGFTEYFDDLDVEGRRAVLGATLPWKPDSRPGAAAWTRGFDELWDAVESRMSRRLQDDLDSRRRSLILGFPVQLSALRARMVSFLSLTFPDDDPLSTVTPRGFYLTSGTQQGTPIDRVIGRLAALYDAPQARGAHGRAYFINRLLHDVMIGEAGLVRRTSRSRARERALLAAGLTAIAVFSVIALSVWTVSYVRNRDFQNRLAAAAIGAEKARKDAAIDLMLVGDADFQQILPLLDSLRTLPGGYNDRQRSGPPLLMTFGLYQGSLSDEAENAYLDTLQRTLLARLLWRLEQVLHAGEQAQVYNALKVYLMLGGAAPPGKFDPDSIKNWAAADWQEKFPGGESAQTRDELGSHLAVLLGVTNLGSVWQTEGSRAPLDNGLIQSARQQIENTPMWESAYAMLKQNAASAGHDWKVSELLSESAARAFQDGSEFRARSVAYLFTKGGFVDAYEVGMRQIEIDLRNDLWIYGPDTNRESTFGQMQELQQAVASRYAQDYIAAWRSILDAMQPADYFSNPDALAAVTAEPSPVALVLQAVARNTRFAPNAAAASSIKSLLPRSLSTIYSRVQKFEAKSGHAADAGAIIDASFKDLHDQIDDGSLKIYFKDLNDAVVASNTARSTPGTQPGSVLQVTMGQATETLKTDAHKVPTVLRSFAQKASTKGEAAQTTIRKSSIAKDYAEVEPGCRSAVEGRYPFQATGTDADKDDLNDVFGSDGKLFDFVTNDLPGYLDMSGPNWHWQTSDPIAASFRDESASELQMVKRVHDLLTKGVGASIVATGWGGDAATADLSVGGIPMHFDKASPAQHAFNWNLIGMQPGASLDVKSQAGKTTTIDGGETIWGVFHLFDKAKRENERRSDFDATFAGDGADFVKFHVTLDSSPNPFVRSGQLWSFRCPRQL